MPARCVGIVETPCLPTGLQLLDNENTSLINARRSHWSGGVHSNEAARTAVAKLLAQSRVVSKEKDGGVALSAMQQVLRRRRARAEQMRAAHCRTVIDRLKGECYCLSVFFFEFIDVFFFKKK